MDATTKEDNVEVYVDVQVVVQGDELTNGNVVGR